MLDAAGFEDMQIMASNSLDEYLVRDLLVQGARCLLYTSVNRLETCISLCACLSIASMIAGLA